jgi:hypothetical protein
MLLAPVLSAQARQRPAAAEAAAGAASH